MLKYQILQQPIGVTVTVTNPLNFGKLCIQKIDKDTHEVIPGIKFKIQKVGDSGYLRTTGDGKYMYDASEDLATNFETNENGVIIVENLELGMYRLIEQQEEGRWTVTTDDIYVNVEKFPNNIGASLAVRKILNNNIKDRNFTYEDLFDLLVRRDRNLLDVQIPKDFTQVVASALIKEQNIENSSKILDVIEEVVKNVEKYGNKDSDQELQYLRDEVSKLTQRIQELSSMSKEQLYRLISNQQENIRKLQRELQDKNRQYDENSVELLKQEIRAIEESLANPNIDATRKKRLEQQKKSAEEKLQTYIDIENEIADLTKQIAEQQEELDKLDIEKQQAKKDEMQKQLSEREVKYTNIMKEYYNTYFFEKNKKYSVLADNELNGELLLRFVSIVSSVIIDKYGVSSQEMREFTDWRDRYEYAVRTMYDGNNCDFTRGIFYTWDGCINEFIGFIIDKFNREFKSEAIFELEHSRDGATQPTTVMQKLKYIYVDTNRVPQLQKQLSEIEKQIRQLESTTGYDPGGTREKQLAELNKQKSSIEAEINSYNSTIEKYKEQLRLNVDKTDEYLNKFFNFVKEGHKNVWSYTDKNSDYFRIYDEQMLSEQGLHVLLDEGYIDLSTNNVEYTYINEIDLLLKKYDNRGIYAYERYYFSNVCNYNYSYIVVENIRKLEIMLKKVDQYTKQPINGIQFKLYGSDSAGNIDTSREIYDNLGLNVYTTTQSNDENGNVTNGIITTGYLKQGTYYLREISAPIPYEVPAVPYGDVRIDLYTSNAVGDYVIKTVTNEKAYFKLQVKKIDRDTKKPIQGVQFKLYGSDAAGNIDVSREVTDISGRNIFETDANGLLFSDYIRKGTYYLREIKTVYPYEVPDAPNGDVRVDLYIGNISNKEQGNDFYITNVNNTQTFVNLEGFAWEDRSPTNEKKDDLNGIYDVDKQDKLLNGISVKLCYNGNEKYLDPNDYKPGSIDKEEYTRRTDTTGNAGEGKYSFKAIRIDDLANYYVEFYYNGMCYENVKVADIMQNRFDIASNENKASEGSARQQFNNKFRTITTNAANGGKSNGGLDLTYSSSNTQSTLTYGGSYIPGWVGNDPNKPVAGVDAQYIISANTNNGYPAGTPQGLTKFVTANFIRQNGIEVIPNINLGIQKRKEVNLSIAKDLNCIELRINGATHVYTYNQVLRDLINNDTADNNIFTQRPNVGVLFGNESYRGSYHRAIYEADLNYVDPIKDDNKNNELEAYVTYQIAIANRGGVAAQVNSIIDYFDANYQIDAIGTGLNGNKQITGNINNVVVDPNTNSGYRKCTITIPEQRIDAGKTKRNLYIRFKLNRNAIITAITEAGDSNSQRNKNLDNIVEIASYTTFNNMNDNTTFGGIDINSNPGNYACPNQYFEDDTDTSPSLKLELNGEERTLSGTVFVDSTGNLALRTGEVREGNGQLDNGEAGVAGVEVTLKEISGTGKSYTETTNNYGNFKIKGYIPGEYELTYKWGNNKYTLNEKEETITVQDYKGTVYNAQRYQRNLTDSYWYKNETERYSDALDNYGTREIVDSQMKDINNKKAYEIEKDKINDYKMISTTPKMKIEIELTDFRESEEGRGVAHTYDVEKVDFGIAERARQAVELNKRISKLRIVKENGEVQVDAEVVPDLDAQGRLKGYKLKKPVQYVTYIPASNAANGQLKVEIDNEIIQGSTLEITYDLQIRNISELDYANKEFYWFGKSSTNRDAIVKATARQIIDYLNNEIIVTSPDPESDKIDIYQTANEKLQHIDNKVHDPNKDYLLQYSEVLYNLLNNSKDRIAILHNDNPALEPNQTTDIFLVTSRVLTNNVDMVVNNQAELVEIVKTGGSSLRVGVSTSVIPGNYIPGTEQHEVDDSSAEQGIITPPTGLSTDIVMYIILTVTALGITVIGIVLIKKYVMK